MQTTTMTLKMTPEPLGLERLLGTMRRRSVLPDGIHVQREADGFLVFIELGRHLEATLRSLLPRVPEVLEIVETHTETFWQQFGMTGV